MGPGAGVGRRWRRKADRPPAAGEVQPLQPRARVLSWRRLVRARGKVRVRVG